MAIYTDYLVASIMYNLQILPETLMCGVVIMAIVLANPSIVALAAAAGGAQLLTSTIARIMMKMLPDGAVVSSSMDMCNSGFIGRSWQRLLRGSPDMLWHSKAPSLYMVSIAFFVGYGWALQQLYHDEINAGAISKTTTTGLSIVSLLILIAAFLFRYKTGCDSLLSTIAGTFLGILMGYLGAISIGYASGRTLTNVWGIPLLVNRTGTGANVYVCPT